MKTFWFWNTRHLHPNDLHCNSMVWTVMRAYLITTLVQSLERFFQLHLKIFTIVIYYLWVNNDKRHLICIHWKHKHLENETILIARNWKRHLGSPTKLVPLPLNSDLQYFRRRGTLMHKQHDISFNQLIHPGGRGRSISGGGTYSYIRVVHH